MNESLDTLAAALGRRLLDRGLSFATAESCTGGWIAKVATDIAGSSAWFDRGFVTYSDAAKQQMLGVLPATLATHGAVSAEVVAEMAEGALRRSAAGFAVAVSGIAGPGGGSDDKPVGTVWFAWAERGAQTQTRLIQFAGDRNEVRHQAVREALEGLLERLGGGG